MAMRRCRPPPLACLAFGFLVIRWISTGSIGAAFVNGAPYSRVSQRGLQAVCLNAKRRRGGGTSTKTKKEEAAYIAKAPPPFAPAEQIGAMMPLGYFDPLEMCPPGDMGKFRRFREAELKHGRVAMLAAVGMVGQHFIKFPGFEKVPSGVLATTVDPGNKGWFVLIVVCGILELFVLKQDFKKEVGDFGDPAGLSNVFGYNTEMRTKEINNGRMAMVSSIGILWAEGATNKDGVDQLIAVLPAGVLPGAAKVTAVAQATAGAAEVATAAAQVAS